MPGDDYFRDTTASAVVGVPGRFELDLSEAWQVAVVPQGGIVAALAARTIASEIDHPDQRLRTITATFAAPVRSDPVAVDVNVIRRGRSMSHGMAMVHNSGATAGVVVTAAFGSTRPGFEFTDVACPDAPPPEECPSFRDPWPEDIPEYARDRQPQEPAPFWTRIEGRAIGGHAPWETWQPTTSERLYWHRFDDPPIAADGRLDPFAVLVLADAMPGAVAERMGEYGDWFGPSVDLTVHVFGRLPAGWVLMRNRARHAGDGYASLDMELWDPVDRRLVAYATQQMVFAFAGEPPPPELRRPRDQR